MVAINGIQSNRTQFLQEQAMLIDQQFIADEGSLFANSSINFSSDNQSANGNIFAEGSVSMPQEFDSSQIGLGDAFKSFGKGIADTFSNLFGAKQAI